MDTDQQLHEWVTKVAEKNRGTPFGEVATACRTAFTMKNTFKPYEGFAMHLHQWMQGAKAFFDTADLELDKHKPGLPVV